MRILKTFIPSLLIFWLTAFYANAQTPIPISEARSRALGATVTIEGVVTNGSELGNIRYLQDSTGGLALFGSNIARLKRGDRVIATGRLKDFNNLLELDPVTNFRVVSENNSEPLPKTIPPNQMNEALESQLVRFQNAVILEGNGTATFSANKTYNFRANNQEGVIYIRAGHPLVNTLIPSCPLQLTGIVSQFYDNYQLLLRGPEDIVARCDIFFTRPLEPIEINSGNLRLGWETNVSAPSFIRYGKTPNLELGKLNAQTNNTAHSVSFDTEPATLYYVQAFSVLGTDTAKSPIELFISKSLSSGKILVYFNRPVDTSLATGRKAEVLHRAIDDTLIAYINRARETIDMAIYNFNNDGLSNISAALNQAYRRGVKIRVIYDESTFSKGVMDLFGEIPRLGRPEGERGIMHNKFIIFDADAANPNLSWIWTGSTNLTEKQINEDENNVILIQDQSLAKVFKMEFEEMWGSNSMTPNRNNARFGNAKTNNTPHFFNIGGKKVECYFSPTDGTNAKILSTIMGAQNTAYAAVMSINRSELGGALVSQHTGGKNVKVIINDSAGAASAVFNNLKRNLANNARYHCFKEIFHHKYFVRDPEPNAATSAVLTGSHNWSGSAESFNDENTLIIYDQEIANLYYQEFSQRFRDLDNDCKPSSWSRPNQAPFAFSIFPNPNSGAFDLQLPSIDAKETTLKIIDIQGKEIWQTQLEAPSSPLLQFEIQLKPGMYIAILQTPSAIFSQKLQIIN
jgi:phosphatidylserine/phosphatidylglycerophosphate/cardiolipin synthase-like enzyme